MSFIQLIYYLKFPLTKWENFSLSYAKTSFKKNKFEVISPSLEKS